MIPACQKHISLTCSIFVIVFFFNFGFLYGQETKTHQENITNDSVKIEDLIQLSKDSFLDNDSLALEYCNQALEIASRNELNTLKLKCYNQLINIHNNLKDYKSAKEVIVEAEQTVLEVSNILEKARHYQLCGMVYLQSTDYNLANYYLSKSLTSYQSLQLSDSLHTIYLAIANLHKTKHEFDVAAKNANLALDLAKSKENIRDIAFSKQMLAIIFAEQKELDIALEYFFQNLEYFQEINDSIEVSQTLNNIALNYYFMGEYDLSLSYSKKSFAIRKAMGNKLGLAENYNNMSLPYIKQGKQDTALSMMSKSLKLFEELEKFKIMPIVLINIGNIKLDQQLYKEAKSYYVKAFELEEQNNRLVANFKYQKNLYKLFSRQALHSQALEHYKLHVDYKDSLSSKEQQQYISELNIQYETEKKERLLELNKQEIKLLQTTQEIKDLKLSNQKTWLYILTIGIIITLAFLLVIVIQMLKKNKAYKILAQKNLEIAKSENILSKVITEGNTELLMQDNSSYKNDQPKYADSQLTDKQKTILLKQITESMIKDKPYLDKSLTLESFSAKLNVSRSYISQVINEELDLNFRNFINEYRVKDARQMLSDPNTKILTIESIALSVGFGSKSAFYTAFKAYTGITPSFYLKSLENK